MLQNYFPILMFVIVGLLVGVGPIVLGKLLAPNRPDAEKLSPYECGFEAFEDARMKFDVRYYLIAILFILFDLEIAFLFPWAVVLKDLGVYGLGVMVEFLAVLTLGFVYMWKKELWNGSRRDSRERLRHDDSRQAYQLYPHGFAVADDLWPGLLRGGDDARRRGAL